jgi:hypothetical protein
VPAIEKETTHAARSRLRAFITSFTRKRFRPYSRLQELCLAPMCNFIDNGLLGAMIDVKSFGIILNLLLALSAMASASVGNDRAFHFPKASAVSMGERNISVDLLKAQEQEVVAAKSQAPKGLSVVQQNAFISSILKKKNAQMISELDSYHSEKSEGFLSAINKAQAKVVLESIRKNPIVSDAGAKKYDVSGSAIGYCFGRAAFVHVELLRRSVDPKSIGKIFAIGPLTYQGAIWDFHVATVVRSTDGGWWAIDGMTDEVLKVEPWMKQVLRWSLDDENPILRFYFADASKFQPTPGTYSDEKLYDPLYRGYFKDLGQWFLNHPVKTEERFSKSPIAAAAVK